MSGRSVRISINELDRLVQKSVEQEQRICALHGLLYSLRPFVRKASTEPRSAKQQIALAIYRNFDDIAQSGGDILVAELMDRCMEQHKTILRLTQEFAETRRRLFHLTHPIYNNYIAYDMLYLECAKDAENLSAAIESLPEPYRTTLRRVFNETEIRRHMGETADAVAGEDETDGD